MNKLYSLSVFSFLLVHLFSYGQDPPEGVKEAKDSIVKISSVGGQGTGFFIDSKTVVTNFHVVVYKENLISPENLILSDGSEVKEIKALSALNDLAILEVKDPKKEFLKISDSKSSTTNNNVYILGFPEGRFKMIEGRISNVEHTKIEVGINRLPKTNGFSGSPILNHEGKVWGIVNKGSSHFMDSIPVENLELMLKKSSVSQARGKELLYIAMEEIQKAAEQNNPDAQYVLGLLYREGIGAPQSDTKALKWFEKAAKQNHSDAQHELGSIYYEEGVHQSVTEALKWFKKAAEQNHPEAQYALGYIHIIDKEGDFYDSIEALKWFKKAAEQNHSDAQYKLGCLYREGIGAPQNVTEALKWFKKAAAQNHPGAQHALGFLHYKGIGVPQNVTEALKWFEKAAEQNQPEAQHALALLHYEGRVIPQNVTEALKWLKKAMENHSEAQKELEKWQQRLAKQGLSKEQSKLGVQKSCYKIFKNMKTNK